MYDHLGVWWHQWLTTDFVGYDHGIATMFFKSLPNDLQYLLITFGIKSYSSHSGIIKPSQIGPITCHFISYDSSL